MTLAAANDVTTPPPASDPSYPPWLVVTVQVILLLGLVLPVVLPKLIDKVRSGTTPQAPPEPTRAAAEAAGHDALAPFQQVITLLERERARDQERIARIEQELHRAQTQAFDDVRAIERLTAEGRALRDDLEDRDRTVRSLRSELDDERTTTAALRRRLATEPT